METIRILKVIKAKCSDILRLIEYGQLLRDFHWYRAVFYYQRLFYHVFKTSYQCIL